MFEVLWFIGRKEMVLLIFWLMSIQLYKLMDILINIAFFSVVNQSDNAI